MVSKRRARQPGKPRRDIAMLVWIHSKRHVVYLSTGLRAVHPGVSGGSSRCAIRQRDLEKRFLVCDSSERLRSVHSSTVVSMTGIIVRVASEVGPWGQGPRSTHSRKGGGECRYMGAAENPSRRSGCRVWRDRQVETGARVYTRRPVSARFMVDGNLWEYYMFVCVRKGNEEQKVRDDFIVVGALPACSRRGGFREDGGARGGVHQVGSQSRRRGTNANAATSQARQPPAAGWLLPSFFRTALALPSPSPSRLLLS